MSQKKTKSAKVKQKRFVRGLTVTRPRSPKPIIPSEPKESIVNNDNNKEN